MLANPRSVKLSHLSRRTFLAMAGQSAAIAGMAASPTVLAQADSARALVTGKYQVFERGNWLPWEREIIERRFAEAAAGPVAANDGPGGIMAGFANVGQAAVDEADIVAYNRTWAGGNPLFTDAGYAQQAGFPGVPAFPNFRMSDSRMANISIGCRTCRARPARRTAARATPSSPRGTSRTSIGTTGART